MKRFKIIDDLEETFLKPEKKKKKIIPKAYMKKYTIPMLTKYNLMLTHWIPQTPKSLYRPCIGITLNISTQKLTLYFSTSRDLLAFINDFSAILKEIAEVSEPILQKETIMWLEYQRIADKMVEEVYIKKTTPKGKKAKEVDENNHQRKILFSY